MTSNVIGWLVGLVALWLFGIFTPKPWLLKKRKPLWPFTQPTNDRSPVGSVPCRMSPSPVGKNGMLWLKIVEMIETLRLANGFPTNEYLVGGLEHFLFSNILGIIIPLDVHIFQMGSNHQPDTNEVSDKVSHTIATHSRQWCPRIPDCPWYISTFTKPTFHDHYAGRQQVDVLNSPDIRHSKSQRELVELSPGSTISILFKPLWQQKPETIDTAAQLHALHAEYDTKCAWSLSQNIGKHSKSIVDHRFPVSIEMAVTRGITHVQTQPVGSYLL